MKKWNRRIDHSIGSCVCGANSHTVTVHESRGEETVLMATGFGPSFLLFQPLHNHEQHQRAAKGRQRQDFKPAQGWNETISMKLDEKNDNYCCEYSQMVQ